MSKLQIVALFITYFGSAMVVLTSTQDGNRLSGAKKNINATLALIPGVNTITAGLNLASKALR
jgi:hypothetical protein